MSELFIGYLTDFRMSQTYRQLLGTDFLSDSRQYLNDSDEALRTRFSGPTEPSSPAAFQLWADTTTGYIKERNLANDGWVIVGVIGAAYGNALPRSGGTMTAGIDMGGFTLTNLGLGTGLAAARQQELDLKAPIAAPQLTGDARVNQDPVGNDSITRRFWTEGRYLKIAGGTLTGPLFLESNAGSALQAVPRQQLETCVTFHTTAGHRHDGADARRVRVTDLDSATAVNGALLIATGSGNTSYMATAALPQPMKFIDDPVQVVNITNFLTTYQTVDVSASTDTDAYAALLRVTFSSTGDRTLRLRKGGIGTDTANQDIGPLNGVYSFVTPIELSATRTFEWRTLTTGTGILKLHLIGTMRKNF